MGLFCTLKNNTMKLNEEFTYKGVRFKIIKRGKNAIMLDAKSDFYDCSSIEVWQLIKTNDRTINGNFIKGGFKKPNNNDYPYSAHQFMSKHFDNEYLFYNKANERFDEYENGLRPKSIK
jgi:hypothetical protein